MKKSSSSAGSAPAGAFSPHTWSPEKVCEYLGVDPSKGLKNEAQVEESKAKWGVNELAEEEGKSLFELIKEQFEDQLVKILLGAAAVSFLLAYVDEGADGEGEGWAAYVEPVVILLILIANAFVGVYQEKNADNALEALKKLQPESAMVLRGGKWAKMEAAEVVVGDIVEVRTGDRVPADIRVVEMKSTTLRIEQSSLTGESASVQKDTDPVKGHDIEIQGK